MNEKNNGRIRHSAFRPSLHSPPENLLVGKFIFFKCLWNELVALFDHTPIDIREECLNIFRSFRRLVVEQEGVLPDVHHQQGLEASNIANFMQCDPVIRQPTVRRILIADSPAHPPHLADTDKVGFP